MVYSENILPKAAAYYTLNRAAIVGTELVLESNGYAEIQISTQMLPKLTSSMLLVVHPSVFSSFYTCDAVQVTLSIITSSGQRIEYLLPISEEASGVFNAAITLPEEEYVSFTYRISSVVPATVYNWELCALEAADITTIIDGVEQTIPKLLYDFNTYSYAVAQNELTVGLISCLLQSATDLQGHFTISFFATERCNVHVRIKDNNITELFSPQVYTVEEGYASISIPHAYLMKTASDHAFSVTLQCSNGQISIPVRGMLYTIDGGYLATRLLDAGIDVEDISIKQLPSDISPSEIWAIGFESSHLLVKNRVYSQLSAANWTAVKDFGEGKKAAIEFNGQWLNRSNSDRYTIETEATPFVFIVDTEDILNVYTGANLDAVFEIDTDVSEIAACRGFNSVYDVEQDQGLLIVYIKSGNAYYRQWLYNDSTQTFMWYPIETLYDVGDASFVSVHRLPDYRVGICVTYLTGTKWYITDRTYVSQAVKPEVVQPMTDGFCVVSVIDDSRTEEVTGVAIQNEFSNGLYFNGFVMTYIGPLVFLDEKTFSDLKWALQVYINDTLLEDPEDIQSITISGNVMTVTLKNAVIGSSVVRIEYNFPYLATTAYNGSWVPTSQTYSWTLPVPIYEYTQEEVVGISATPTLDVNVRALITTELNPNEEVAATIQASLTCTVNALTTLEDIVEEDISASINPSLTLSVQQTGVTPV